MRPRRITFVVPVVLAVIVAACQTAQPDLPGREARRTDLEERDFISAKVEFQGEPVELVPGPQFGTATLIVRFGLTRIGATGGCNWHGAEGWALVGGQLAVNEEFDGTLMACDVPSQRQDEWLLEFLRSGPQVRIDGDRLMLIADENVVTFLETDVEDLPAPASDPDGGG